MIGPKKSEARKAQIQEAAQTVFARKGFQEATISDVARLAGISDATIYEYFTSKEELLFSIPLETTNKANEILEFHLNYVRGAANRIRSVIYHYLNFYQSNMEYASVIMLILKTNRKFLETEAYQSVRRGMGLILKVIQEGIETGEFKPDIDPYLVRSVILGTIEHTVIRWVLMDRHQKIEDVVDPLVDLIIDGIRTRDAERSLNLKITMSPPDKSGPEKGQVQYE